MNDPIACPRCELPLESFVDGIGEELRPPVAS
jgi:hypothetical protein